MPQSNVITLAELDVDYLIPEDVNLESDQYATYIDALKKQNVLPFSKGNILYSDDVWDFSGFTTLNIPASALKINFANAPEEFRDDVKNYVLAKILDNQLKIQSIHSSAKSLWQFFRYAVARHIYTVDDITKGFVKDYLQMIRDTKSITALRIAKTNIKSFFLQYSVNFHNIAQPGIIALFEYDDHKAFAAHKEQNRSKDIPHDYAIKLRTALNEIAHNETLPVDIRAAACVYIILMQTGLRIGEVLGLYPDSLQVTTLFNGDEAYYFNYRTWKREHLNNKATTARTAANSDAKAAFDLLNTLHKDKRAEMNMPFLYMGSKRFTKASQFPLCSNDFREDAFDLMIAIDQSGLLDTVNLDESRYPDLHRYSVRHRLIKSDDKKSSIKVTTLTFPDTQQFRFHCCTELYNAGVSFEYIKRFMSHLTNEMVKHHIYPAKTPQENMEYATTVLKGIISGETPILGPDKGLTDKIKRFIEENNFSVARDLDEISKQLALKIPIRQKAGGVCIKSSQMRDCSIDGPTDDFYCAYGVCPNIFHFYYMADITYRQCKELEEVIGVNRIREQMFYAERGNALNKTERNAYPKQIQKNLNMLYSLATKKLAPELEDLKRAISEQGAEHVFQAHPEIVSIVGNLDVIEKEVATWMSLKP
ncbi:hypothetical protein [Porcincola intestinalis]|uniref:hypothetical protein n=1 Tax=Porcincola intestinalis TaxID=2606632 RepID=UPI002A9173F1|nr:hypothetical protein [Porcincola intestinalis]MDY5578398.1 hypothetical protein [Porcincola intestinalis]